MIYNIFNSFIDILSQLNRRLKMALKNIGVEKYKITVELGVDVFKKRRRKIVTFNGTKEAAKKEEARLKNEYYHKLNSIKTNDLTFKEFSTLFIEKYCKKVSLERIIPIIGDIKLNRINPYILDNMYDKLSIGITGKELGYCSMYNFYKLINLMFNTAVRWEIMDRNPNAKASKPKKIYKEKNYYDVNQVKKLLSVLEYESIKNRFLIHLAIDSGCRRSEICALRWSDIDTTTKTMTISKSLEVVNGIVDEKIAKTNSSIRKIVLSDNTMQLLEEYRDWQEEYKIINKKRWIEEDRVFTSKNGTHMHPCTCTHIINDICKKYNLDKIKFHELRHTSTSLLINQGIDIKTVSTRIGHSDVSTTMRIYAHSFDSEKEKCAVKMNDILSSI